MKFAYFALFSAASAFYAPAPSFVGRTGISRAQTSPLFSTEGRFGEYDDKLWDNEAKKLIYDKWDPNAARSPMNFNPFETYGGNSPDASGYFPGEGFFKDPQRGDINFAQMMVERTEAEERAASPKAGDVPGAPGRMKGN